MGYELPGGLGARLADPTRDVFVWVGDATYLMMPSELVTAAQEGIKIIVVLVDNKGFGSIGSLSRSLGMEGFGTTVKKRSESGSLDGEDFVVDYAANARSLGVDAVKVATIDEFKKALVDAKASPRTTVVVIETEGSRGVPGYDSWWDVAVPEVSTMTAVQAARSTYEEARKRERYFFNNSQETASGETK
jgi:3D-(3,5/4)-trihydroxycyclohexane-1,2-dione acylhydrolase (decyclizing)